MGNPSYDAGRRFEYQIMKILEEHLPKDKYTVVRSAGSHSPVDIIVLKHVGAQGVDREYFGIQCKTKKLKAKAGD